jgi:hypothetical protein
MGEKPTWSAGGRVHRAFESPLPILAAQLTMMIFIALIEQEHEC